MTVTMTTPGSTHCPEYRVARLPQWSKTAAAATASSSAPVRKTTPMTRPPEVSALSASESPTRNSTAADTRSPSIMKQP
ncbi:hypothetical protein ACFWBF_32835 [Streptomyces sp. NPDC060028]|uniref:hypothetical protein n=1 Tax=Streptomyces sp. NPDC060028 TaxID=3347041 RepID=UPI003679B369